jgi:hypothetical protein
MIHNPKSRKGLLVFAFIGYGIFCLGQEKVPDSNNQTVRHFAARFYDWYVKRAADADRIEILSTEEMRRALSPELLQALKRDYEAQAQDNDYIVGLDFDPFLAAQDPCDRYEVGKIVKKGESYWAEIHGVGGCYSHDEPDLSAELTSRNGGWKFVNFHYPGRYAKDLRSLLAHLRRNRLKR